jgi:hypothetical protein
MLWEGGRADWRRLALPIGPCFEIFLLEPGLEGFFQASSRPVPNLRADAAKLRFPDSGIYCNESALPIKPLPLAGEGKPGANSF